MRCHLGMDGSPEAMIFESVSKSRATFLFVCLGESIRQAKFSSLSQKFVTFARRKILLNEKFHLKGIFSFVII